MIPHTVPDIAEKIGRLFSAMKNSESSDVIAKDINDILIYVDKIPVSLLNPSWDYFAKRKGVSI